MTPSYPAGGAWRDDPEGMLALLAPDGRLLGATGAALALLGAAADRHLGTPVWSMPACLACQRWADGLRDAVAAAAAGRAVRGVLAWPGPGAPRDLTLTLTPVRAAGGAVAHLVATFGDGREDAVGRLIHLLAHEFNNLLTAIRGNAELAHTMLPPTAEVQPELREVIAAADRGAALTRQVLAYSRTHGERGLGHDPGTAAELLGRLTSAIRAVRPHGGSEGGG
jgi:signal transduction histidine kinase